MTARLKGNCRCNHRMRIYETLLHVPWLVWVCFGFVTRGLVQHPIQSRKPLQHGHSA